MAFDFTVSNSSVSIAPGETAQITITQTSSDSQSVQYGVSSLYAGGWDAFTFLDQGQSISAVFDPSPAVIEEDGSLTLTFTASSDAQAQTLVIQVYGLQQMTGDPNSTINQAQTVTLEVS
jgi:hypothetical protein